VAIALVDYASGFGKSYLLELPSRKGAWPH
jgi:hypothetical protein